MRIAHVIGHPNINGGTVAVCELISGLKRYCNQDSDLYVVNSTGKKDTTDFKLISTKNVSVKGFFARKSFGDITKNYDVVLQHRLDGTLPLSDVKCKYVVINHTMQSPSQLKQFVTADKFISVSKYVDDISPYPHQNHCVIINGIEKYEGSSYAPLNRSIFHTGRCHRLCSEKFPTGSLPYLKTIPNHQHWIIGQHIRKQSGSINFLGPISNTDKKMAYIRQFDLYFYDAIIGEGTSMAVLESFSVGVPVLCRGKPGTCDVVKEGINGKIYHTYVEAVDIIKNMTENRDKLHELKKSTVAYFDEFLHIRHCVKRYMEALK